MAFPIVAIVGRPNVGKSSLFNSLAGRRISIVDPTAGVTRDRVSTIIDVEGKHFELMDTGGMGIDDVDNLTADVEHQISVALETASLILFVVDIREGVTPLDQVVGERLRKIAKPMIFVANKADESHHDVGAGDLYRLGYGEAILVSANSRRGREELLFAIIDKLPNASMVAPRDAELKLAIVGRRNVGKSTFINSIAEEDRVIVSEIAGTTRDSIDVRFERDGKAFLAIDTAGVRKRTKMASDVEYYSFHRAERSIRRADVVLHFFDSRYRIGRVDKQLAEYVIENHKPCIFVVNKWDLVRHAMDTEKMAAYIRKVFGMLDYVPIAFTTAKTGKNTFRVFNLAQQLQKQCGQRIPTGELNRIIRMAMEVNVPPLRNNKQGKIFYAAQVGVNPPTIALVTNGREAFERTYIKYLVKVLRDNGPFGEVPIKIILRAKGESVGDSKLNVAEEITEESLDSIPVYDLPAEESPLMVEEPVAEELPLEEPEPEPQPQPQKQPKEKKPKKKRPPGVWEL